MSSVRDEILKKRKSMSPDEFKKTEPEETTGMKAHRTIKKIKGVANLLGIGSSIGSSSGARGGAHAHHNQARDFRESMRVHSEPLGPSHGEKIQELANMREYMKMIDGKGDHDCGHEH